MSEEDTEELLELMELREQLIQLKEEHRDLDAAIHHMASNPYSDQMRLGRMKKRKLSLKDQIQLMEIFRGIMPYLAFVIFCMVLMYIFPGIALWLPDYLFGVYVP